MSSSAESTDEAAPADDELDWSVFKVRPTTSGEMELRSPASETLAALQSYQQDRDAELAASRQATDRALAIAATHVVKVFRLGVVLDEHTTRLRDAGLDDVARQLQIVRQQMLDAMTETNLAFVDPVGMPFETTVDRVDVVDWRHGSEFTDEVVAETIEPIVLHDERVIRNGRVIMGAPEDSEERA